MDIGGRDKSRPYKIWEKYLLRLLDDPWVVFYKSLKPFLFSVFDLNH